MDMIGALLHHRVALRALPAPVAGSLEQLAELVAGWADGHCVDLVADDTGRLHDHGCPFAVHPWGADRTVDGSAAFDEDRCCECAAELVVRLAGDDAAKALADLAGTLDALVGLTELDPPTPLTLEALARRCGADNDVERLCAGLEGRARSLPGTAAGQPPEELRDACALLAAVARSAVAARRARLSQPDVRGFVERFARCALAADAVMSTTVAVPQAHDMHTQALPAGCAARPAGSVAFEMWADRRAAGDDTSVAAAAFEKLGALGAEPVRVDQLPENPHRPHRPGETTSQWAQNIWSRTAVEQLAKLEERWDAHQVAAPAPWGPSALFVQQSDISGIWFADLAAAAFLAGADGDDRVLVVPAEVAALWLRSELPLVAEEPAPDGDAAFDVARLALQLLGTGAAADHRRAMAAAHALCNTPGDRAEEPDRPDAGTAAQPRVAACS